MEAKKESASNTAGRELAITRLLNAPRELVWEVFTQPNHIKNWWGPNGFTNTIEKMEVKPGGSWEFVMHGPDGVDYKNIDVFKEVMKPERIVFEHVNMPRHITTITFTAEGQKTRLNWHMLFESKEEFENVVKTFKADEGLTQNIAKLETYLGNEQAVSPKNTPLIITRIFDAPREVVFKAWTDPKQVAQWWGPKDFTNPVCELDVRPGGTIRIDMTFPDGTAHPMGGEFHEVDAPNRLVFTSKAFYDEKGVPALEVLNTITFADHQGKTKLTLKAQVTKSSPEVSQAIAGMNEGWSQSLDRLDALADGATANQTAPAKSKPLHIERTLNAPIDQVWKAITEKKQIKQWFIDFDGLKPEVGCEFTFEAGKNGVKLLHLCKVTEVITGKKLSYTWRYDGYPGDSLVTFELSEDGNKTRLKLTHTGLETFPQDGPNFLRKNFYAGWTTLIGTSLPDFLKQV